MGFKDLTKSNKLRGFVIGFAAAAFILLIFRAGVAVGYRKALFSARLGNNYYRPFGDLPGGHGAIGKIVSITWPTLVLAGPDNVEKIILLKDDTIIRRFRETVATSSLALNDSVVVLGAPNDQGEIEARLIRIMK